MREREGKFRANQIWRGRGDETVGTSRNMLANMLMQSVGWWRGKCDRRKNKRRKRNNNKGVEKMKIAMYQFAIDTFLCLHH